MLLPLDFNPTDSISSHSALRSFFETASPMENAFWLSVVFVVCVSLLKYYCSKNAGGDDIVRAILEVPIDICALMLTLILSIYIPVEGTTFGAILLGGTIICVIITCVLRNKALNNYDKDGKNLPFVLLVTELLIALFWTTIIYTEMP